MNKIDRLRMRHELAVLFFVTALILALAACQPIVDPALLEAQGTMPAAAEATTEAEVAPAATEEPAAETAEATPIPGLEPAQATVNTRSLRVRGEPNEASEVVTGVREGETYDVLGISSDGIWIHLAIPRAPEGTGWVSAEFVTLEGDITNIDIVEVGDGSEDSAPVAEEAEAPEEVSEEAGASEEAGSEAADEESATEESAPAEGETAEATDDESATADEDMTEAGEDSTEAAATDDEAGEEAPQVASPDAGYVLINTGGTPLRVRSEPTTEVDNKVGNVFDGEIYQVLEISEDGEWVRIAVPQLDLEDGGWVSAEFVVMGE